MGRPDRHNEIELNLLKRGTLTYLFGGERVTVSHGGLHAFWATIPHQIIEFTGDPDYYVVTLPLAWLLQCRLPSKFVDRLLHGHFLRDPTPQRIELDVGQFRAWESELSGGRRVPGTALLLELHARLARFADSLPEQNEASEGDRAGTLLAGGALSKVEQMAAYIARHYQDSAPIEEIAADVGLHPNYAMNLFKKTFNLTINEFLTQHRISHAQRLLASTDHKVIDVALASGFPTLSRFYEAFKQSCGCPPSSYRRKHRIGDSPRREAIAE